MRSCATWIAFRVATLGSAWRYVLMNRTFGLTVRRMKHLIVVALLVGCGTSEQDALDDVLALPHRHEPCNENWLSETCEAGCNVPLYSTGACDVIEPVAGPTSCFNQYRFVSDDGLYEVIGCCGIFDPTNQCDGVDCLVKFTECSPRG